MVDSRFTTVAQDMDELIDALDVDGVDDLETLLIVLFGRSITVEEMPDEDAEFEVVVWDDTLGFGTPYAFPLSMVDLTRGCAEVVSELRSNEGEDLDEDDDLPDLRSMDEGELITVLQRALGQVRIYNMLHEDET